MLRFVWTHIKTFISTTIVTAILFGSLGLMYSRTNREKSHSNKEGDKRLSPVRWVHIRLEDTVPVKPLVLGSDHIDNNLNDNVKTESPLVGKSRTSIIDSGAGLKDIATNIPD